MITGRSSPVIKPLEAPASCLAHFTKKDRQSPIGLKGLHFFGEVT